MADLQRSLKKKILSTLLYLENEYFSVNNCGKEDKEQVDGKVYATGTCSYSSQELQAAKAYAIGQFRESFDEVIFDFDLAEGEDVSSDLKASIMELVQKYEGV